MKKIIGVLALVMVLVLSACGSGVKVSEEAMFDKQEASKETTADTIEQKNEAVPESEVSEPAAPEREKIMAPDFTLLDREGKEVSLSDYQGKIVFLNFFATWCTYCEQEMPDFQEASEKYKDDVEFLIIDVFPSERISEEEVYEWYDSRGFTMDMLIDVNGDLGRDYPVQGYPTTFFVDRDGSILAYYPGMMTTELIDEVVAQFR